MLVAPPRPRPPADTGATPHGISASPPRRWRHAADAQPVSAHPAHAWERLGLVLVDFLVVNVAFYLAWFARYEMALFVELDPSNYVEHGVYVPLQLTLAAVFVFIVGLRGLYHMPRGSTALDDLSTLFTAAGLALMALFAASTFVRYPAESRLTLVFAWLLITVLGVVGRAAFLWALGVIHSRGLGVSRTLVVGNNPRGRMIMQGLAGRPHLGLQVAGFLSNEETAFGRFRHLGREDELERVIAQERINQVMIALPSRSHEAIMRIVDHCRRDGVQFRVVPDLYEMSLGRVDVDTVSGIPLLGLKDASIQGVNFVLKRGIDLLGATLALVVASVPFLLIAAAIKLDDPNGPVFFGQTRVGRNGRQFTAWKFRSMRRDADQRLGELLAQNESDRIIFKMREDPRRTRVGRFIRRFSLDELPQLLNVLTGHMSLVGPRPPTPREVALYEDWHLQRLAALPGLTGLWQVSGRSELGFDEMVMLDITYIENWSLGLDLRILLRTFPAVVSGKGAF